jgi:hypothetical protein
VPGRAKVGINGGTAIGKPDPLCINVIEDKVHVHDLQGTMLHYLGWSTRASRTTTWDGTFG